MTPRRNRCGAGTPACRRLSSRRPTARAAERGVTLIEMMIVVTLIAIMVGISWPAVGSSLDSLRLSSAGDRVASFLQGAINRVERRERMMQLSINREDHSLTLEDQDFERRYVLEDGVTIAEILPALAAGAGTNQPRRFLLYPGGSPPRIQLRLVNRRGAERLVSLDPVTGAAQVERVDAR